MSSSDEEAAHPEWICRVVGDRCSCKRRKAVEWQRRMPHLHLMRIVRLLLQTSLCVRQNLLKQCPSAGSSTHSCRGLDTPPCHILTKFCSSPDPEEALDAETALDLLSIGISNPVTKETAGVLYNQELSRQAGDKHSRSPRYFLFCSVPAQFPHAECIERLVIHSQLAGVDLLSPVECSFREYFRGFCDSICF